MNTFGFCLRQFRKTQEVSQRFLAEQLGFSATYLHHVEIGKRGPLSFSSLLKVQKTLELTDEQVLRLVSLAAHHKQGLRIHLGQLQTHDKDLLKYAITHW